MNKLNKLIQILNKKKIAKKGYGVLVIYPSETENGYTLRSSAPDATPITFDTLENAVEFTNNLDEKSPFYFYNTTIIIDEVFD